MHITYSRTPSRRKTNRSRLCAALKCLYQWKWSCWPQKWVAACIAFLKAVKLLCFTKKGKLHLTDIHTTEADSQPSWDKLIVLGPWLRPESPVCHRAHLCSQQQHSWARKQNLLTAAPTDGLSPNKLLPPLLSCLRSLFTDLYGQILIKAPSEWRKVLHSRILPLRVSKKGKGIACVQPQEEPALQCAVQQCSTGMHKLLLCWPSTAVQREGQIKYHTNSQYSPPNLCKEIWSQSLGQPYKSRQFW